MLSSILDMGTEYRIPSWEYNTSQSYWPKLIIFINISGVGSPWFGLGTSTTRVVLPEAKDQSLC